MAFEWPKAAHVVVVIAAGEIDGIPWIAHISDTDNRNDNEGGGAAGVRVDFLTDTNGDERLNLSGTNREITGLVILEVGNFTPSLTVTNPTKEQAFVPSSAITINGKATFGDKVQVRVDSGQATDVVINADGIWSFVLPTQLAKGDHIITVNAINTSTSEKTAEIKIPIIIKDPPSVTITSPDNNSKFITGQTVTITGTATDANGTDLKDKIEWIVGTPDGDAISPSSGASSIDVILTLPGKYTIKAIITDSAGLESEHTIEVISSLLPAVRITPADNAISFSQVDYIIGDDSFPNLDTLLVSMSHEKIKQLIGKDDIAFLTFGDESRTIATNIPVLLGLDKSHTSYELGFGTSGVDLTSIGVCAALSPEPLSSFACTPEFVFTFFVDDFTMNTGDGDCMIGQDNSAKAPPTPNFTDILLGKVDNVTDLKFLLGFNNIEAAQNQCFPAAVTNSFEFLKKNNLNLNLPLGNNIPGLSGDETPAGMMDDFVQRRVDDKDDRRNNSGGTNFNLGIEGILKYVHSLGLDDTIKTTHYNTLVNENIHVVIEEEQTALISVGQSKKN